MKKNINENEIEVVSYKGLLALQSRMLEAADEAADTVSSLYDEYNEGDNEYMTKYSLSSHVDDVRADMRRRLDSILFIARQRGMLAKHLRVLERTLEYLY